MAGLCLAVKSSGYPLHGPCSKNAPVLILDEATSSVDLANKEKKLRACARLTQDKTVLMIAQRLWTVVNANEIWLMESGSIVERGQHSGLVAAGGLYTKLWQAQREAKSWRIQSWSRHKKAFCPLGGSETALTAQPLNSGELSCQKAETT